MPLEPRPLEISEELMERLLRRENERSQSERSQKERSKKERSEGQDADPEMDQTDQASSSKLISGPQEET
jgi:hypothetical protein